MVQRSSSGSREYITLGLLVTRSIPSPHNTSLVSGIIHAYIRTCLLVHSVLHYEKFYSCPMACFYEASLLSPLSLQAIRHPAVFF
ncbi:MAG: hypothetical protein NTV68_02430 [Methanomicrobiales archaeon]|nr:hypothetical protein [Methanomicrobiales archaeon]